MIYFPYKQLIFSFLPPPLHAFTGDRVSQFNCLVASVEQPYFLGKKIFRTVQGLAQRASKGKQIGAQGIFTPFGVQCKVFLQGFARRTKKRAQGIFTPSGIQ